MGSGATSSPGAATAGANVRIGSAVGSIGVEAAECNMEPPVAAKENNDFTFSGCPWGARSVPERISRTT